MKIVPHRIGAVRGRRPDILAASVAIAAAAGLTASALQPLTAEGRLTLEQVETGMKVLSPRRIATLVRERGSTFILGAEEERRFRGAAAAERIDSALLDEIVRLLAPPRRPATGMDWTAPTDSRPMVWIPAGAFQMGSPASESAREPDEARHSVTLTNGFWMESTEVTYRAFQRFVLANPSWQKDRIDRRLHDGNYLADWRGNEFPPGKADAPVVNVNWYASRAYAAWVRKRLPTEAEWEYACRAGRQSAYWWGETFDAAQAGLGSKAGAPKNPWGLSAMPGGVWEWTSSLYREYPFSDDGRNDAAAQGMRVIRGGSGTNDPRMLRSGNRNRDAPERCSDLLGFRCVL